MYDVAIIGCGIIGAATAYELSRYNLSVILLEKRNDVCNETTKANSAIIHAGYDPHPGTLMARLNVEGSRLTQELCASLDVPYKKIGSMVLAFNNDELETLQTLYERGVQNGVEGLKLLSATEALSIEPNISAQTTGALLAPSAAIVNPWEYGIALAEAAVKNGVELRLRAEVSAVERTERGFSITASGKTIEAAYIVNAAGVESANVHNMVAAPTFSISPNRGEYYLLDKSEGSRVNHVIFQCPSESGKGVLISPTVHGNLIVGPNAQKVDDGDNVSNTSDGLSFVSRSAFKSVPSLSLRDNIRNFAGIRSNSDRPDFIIEMAAPGFLDLAGICSPGLSAAPAIATEAVKLLEQDGLATSLKNEWDGTRKKTRFAELSPMDKSDLIKENPAYGRVICRCETITEGEIIDALRGPIPPCSIDGVKRRAGSGMGRCQGGFCGPRILDIMSREYGLSPDEILQDGDGSNILTGETKRGRIHA